MKAKLTATVATIALAMTTAATSSASAAVRTGSVQDPQGDASSLSGPAADLKSVAVRYDDAVGSVRLTWTYYNDVRAISGPSGRVETAEPNPAPGVLIDK